MHNTTEGRPVKVLAVQSSGRSDDSTTRQLVADLVAALEQRHGAIDFTERDLARGIAHVDQNWINANFTPTEERNDEQRNTLSESDRLVDELKAADIVVIGSPIYNFGVPAALKAWVDMIARARLTFRYTENGPEGLLKGKKAYVVIASGGVPVDSPADFATPYLRHALGFVGVTDVSVISADRLNARGADAIDDARAQIADVVHTAPLDQSSAA